MDIQKIGSFLAELRREQNLTQEQLGDKLGVTNKTVSRWENGNYLPPVEMLQLLSELYGVSINEIISGERLQENAYREKAEENIKTALDQSAFTLKEKISYYKKKWTQDHLLTTVLWITAIFGVYVYGAVFGLEQVQFAAVLGFIACSILRYNVMMAYVEGKAFDVPDMGAEEALAQRKGMLLLRRVRMAVMLILALSVWVTLDLGYNYFSSLLPEMNDGLTVRGLFGGFAFDDDFWSRALFFSAFANAMKVTGFLTIGNLLLACVEKWKQK